MLDQTGATAKELDRFLASYEKRAFRMAMLATKQQQDALDIVQDAMMKLVKRYSHRASDEWPALFIRIVENAIVDWHRRENVRRRWRHWFSFGQSDDDSDTEDPLQQIAQTGVSMPDELVQQGNAITALDRVLAHLPLRQQQAFLLRQVEGMDVKQTAKAMGISSGSVKTHYSRAVHRLRELLEEHW